MTLPIKHGFHDARKLNTVKNAKSSTFMYGYGRIEQATEKLAGIVGRADAVRVKDAFLVHFYDGGRPIPVESENQADIIAQALLKHVYESKRMIQQRMLARHNIWSADVVAARVFTELIKAIPEEDLVEGLPEAGEEDSQGQSTQDQESGSNSSEEQQEDNTSPEDAGEGPNEGKDHNSESQEPCDEGAESEDEDGNSESEEDKQDDVNHEDDTIQQDGRWQDAVDKAMEGLESEFATQNEGGTSINDDLKRFAGVQEKIEESPFNGTRYSVNSQKIADRMGRIRNTLIAAMADKVHATHTTPVKIEFGNNIKNALRHQFVHLDEDTEVILRQQIMSRSLAQRSVKGIARAGKGPIIIAIDVSGSTRGNILEWEIALAGAIGWAAAKKRRDVALIFYDNKVCEIIHVPSRLRRDVKSLDKAIGSIVHNPLLGFAAHELSIIERLNERLLYPEDPWKVNPIGGATNFKSALEAVSSLMDYKPIWRYADVLFLSDGQDGSPREVIDPLLKQLQNKGVRIYGIGLVNDTHQGNNDAVFEKSMGNFDNYVISRVGEDTDANEVLEAIGRGL